MRINEQETRLTLQEHDDDDDDGGGGGGGGDDDDDDNDLHDSFKMLSLRRGL